MNLIKHRGGNKRKKTFISHFVGIKWSEYFTFIFRSVVIKLTIVGTVDRHCDFFFFKIVWR